MRIVFSYDCEGNWGFVDRADPVLDASLADPLARAYETLRDLHLDYKIPATFAFVGFYALTAEARREYLAGHAEEVHNRAAFLAREGGCWDGAENFETILSASRQSDLIEIGSHSLTHIPFDRLNATDQRDELLASKRLLGELSAREPESFIYPRNIFDSVADCRAAYRTYRNTPPEKGVAAMAHRLRVASGLLPNGKPQQSDIVYWRGGSWKLVPDGGWRRLWRRRMQIPGPGGADQTIHVWTHPHNMVTDPGQVDRLRWLFDLLAQNRDNLSFLKLSEVGPDGQRLPAAA